MKKMSVAAVILAGLFLSVIVPAVMGIFSWPAGAYAEDDWKKEFEDICAVTQDVMAFSPTELKGFIERCDRLKPAIEKLGDTERRVYLKRLEMCRNIFAYTLEVKENR